MIHVRRAGLLTSVQDRGRYGYQSRGVPVGGPMDAASMRLANALVGNDEGAAALEVTLVGPEIAFDAPATIAVAGGDLDPVLDGAPIPMHETVPVRPGQILSFGGRRRGARAYVAFDGGIETPVVLGSRATHLVSRTGGVEGRALVRGDHLPLGAPRPAARRRARGFEWPAGEARLRVLPGPHVERFTAEALADLVREAYALTGASNRMGYRLDGARLAHVGAADIISEAVTMGALQVPASGRPILLMADRQTSGGSPVAATVISADLSVAGQLLPGDRVRFEWCDVSAAITALVAQERRLLGIR